MKDGASDEGTFGVPNPMPCAEDCVPVVGAPPPVAPRPAGPPLAGGAPNDDAAPADGAPLEVPNDELAPPVAAPPVEPDEDDPALDEDEPLSCAEAESKAPQPAASRPIQCRLEIMKNRKRRTRIRATA